MNAKPATQNTKNGTPESAAFGRLFTREFICLNAVLFLAFCNLAVFFRFYEHLHTLPIDPRWFGLLMGVFSLTALVLRPLISPFLHPHNAVRCMLGSCLAVIAVLLGYNLTRSFWPLLLIRILHGAAYVGLVTAMMTMVVRFIPKEKSGQAFAFISINALVPYAVIPFVLSALTRKVGSFNHVLSLTALLMVLVFPLLLAVRLPAPRPGGQAPGDQPMGLRELGRSLKNRPVAVLLTMTLLFYCGYTSIFFFLEGFGRRIGIAHPGLFLTLAFATMIVVRVAAGPLFDHWGKRNLLGGSLCAVILGYGALAMTTGPVSFYLVAVLLGTAWAIAMPLFTALMFDISPPRFQGLNVNLIIEMVDGGFFLGPLVGGLLVGRLGYGALFGACAGYSLLALVLLTRLKG